MDKQKSPYDPKLREAAAEFRELCKKYDCMGFCLFVSPSHSEFVNEFNSSWSVIRLESANAIRFRSKREDFPSKEAQHFATESSTHALTSAFEWSRQTHIAMGNVLTQLKGKMRFAWSAWDKPDSIPGDGK